MRKLLTGWAAIAALFAFGHAALSQEAFPSRSITVVVPFGAGSSPDIIARLISARLADRLGRPVVVDNRPGAAGNLGAEIVANAQPDGHTLLYAVNSVICANPHLYSKLRFDPLALAPVTGVANIGYVVLGRPKLGASTFAELISLAKSEPGKLTFSSSGYGAGNHIVMEMMMKAAGITMLHVPMRNNVTLAPLTGEVDLTLSPYTTGVPAAQSGEYRAYAVTGARRLDTLPGVPAVAEMFPGFLGDGWHGLFAPSGTPQSIVEKISTETRAIITSPEFQKRFVELSLEAIPMTPAQFSEVVRSDHRKWGQVINEAGIKLN